MTTKEYIIPSCSCLKSPGRPRNCPASATLQRVAPVLPLEEPGMGHGQLIVEVCQVEEEWGRRVKGVLLPS